MTRILARALCNASKTAYRELRSFNWVRHGINLTPCTELETQMLAAALRAIATKGWFAFLIVGVALLAAGAGGEIPWTSLRFQPTNQLVLMIIGGLLVAFGAYLLSLERRQAVIEANAKNVFQTNPDPKVFDVTISNHQCEGRHVKLSGRIKKILPKGIELWVVTISGRTAKWPQTKVYPRGTGKNRHWTAAYNAGPHGDTRTVQMFLVGPNGQALFSCYFRYNEKYGRTGNWESLTERTDDTIEACEPYLIRLPAAKGPSEPASAA